MSGSFRWAVTWSIRISAPTEYSRSTSRASRPVTAGRCARRPSPTSSSPRPGLSAKAPKEISCQNLAAIIEARMQDIIDFAVEEIKKSGYQNKLSAGVVLTGGGAQLRDLDALFKSYTGMDVRVAGPEAVLAAVARRGDGPRYVYGRRNSGQGFRRRPSGAFGPPESFFAPSRFRFLRCDRAQGRRQPAEDQRSVSERRGSVPLRTVRSRRVRRRGGRGVRAEEGQEAERKPGTRFFSKIKEKMINMFDEEIDDNEI